MSGALIAAAAAMLAAARNQSEIGLDDVPSYLIVVALIVSIVVAIVIIGAGIWLIVNW